MRLFGIGALVAGSIAAVAALLAAAVLIGPLLFWLAWTSYNGLSVFSTADASGPFRRIILSATCTTLQGQVQEEPLREILFNLSNVLSDPGICPKA